MPAPYEECALVIDETLPSLDILTSHGKAGEHPSLRWPEKSWRPSYSVSSIWCHWTSLVTLCWTTAQSHTLKKQWVGRGGYPTMGVSRWTFFLSFFHSFLHSFFLFFSIEPCKSSIYPFQELKRPLQFLGLYDTTLCNVTHIPAYKVLVI